MSARLPRKFHSRTLETWLDQARHRRKPELLHECADRFFRRVYSGRWYLGARKLRGRHGRHGRAFRHLQLPPGQQSLQRLQPDPDPRSDMGCQRGLTQLVTREARSRRAACSGWQERANCRLPLASCQNVNRVAIYSLSLSKTSSGWRLTENRAMLLFNEGSFQAHWLDGCRPIPVAGSARGRDLDIAAAN